MSRAGGLLLDGAVKVVVSYAESASLSTPGSVLGAHTVRTLARLLGGFCQASTAAKQIS